MTVREATHEDLKTMAILWRMMVKEVSPGSEMNMEWWLAYQKEMMPNPNTYRAFVAFSCGEMVGYIVGVLYPDAIEGRMVAFGQEFYIMPEFRDDKLAAILYGRLVRLGKEKGADDIEMTCFDGQLDMWKSKGYHVQKYHIRRSI